MSSLLGRAVPLSPSWYCPCSWPGCPCSAFLLHWVRRAGLDRQGLPVLCHSCTSCPCVCALPWPCFLRGCPAVLPPAPEPCSDALWHFEVQALWCVCVPESSADRCKLLSTSYAADSSKPEPHSGLLQRAD